MHKIEKELYILCLFLPFLARQSNSLNQLINMILRNYTNLLLVFWLKDEIKNQTFKASLQNWAPYTTQPHQQGTHKAPNQKQKRTQKGRYGNSKKFGKKLLRATCASNKKHVAQKRATKPMLGEYLGQEYVLNKTP
jgi:hypothetical protein